MKIGHVYHIHNIMCCMALCASVELEHFNVYCALTSRTVIVCISRVHMFKVNWRKRPKLLRSCQAQHNTMSITFKHVHVVYATHPLLVVLDGTAKTLFRFDSIHFFDLLFFLSIHSFRSICRSTPWCSTSSPILPNPFDDVHLFFSPFIRSFTLIHTNTCSSAVCMFNVHYNILSSNRKSKGYSAANIQYPQTRWHFSWCCILYPMLHVNDKIIWWNKYDLHNACHIRYFSMSLIILLWATTNSASESAMCGEQTGWLGWMDGWMPLWHAYVPHWILSSSQI